MNSFVTLAYSLLQFVFVCECVARACVQCERTSVHWLSQWVWLVRAWSAVLAASCLCLVAARR